MEIPDDFDPMNGSATKNLVGHDEDGNAIEPRSEFERSERLDSPVDVSDEAFEYHEPHAGPMAELLYEPIGMVNDDRLLDTYRVYEKKAQGSSNEARREKADTLRAFVTARGLSIPDTSQWYAAELTRGDVKRVEEEIPEFFTYAKGLESVEAGNVNGQMMRVRFCECDLETVVELTDATPQPISGPTPSE